MWSTTCTPSGTGPRCSIRARPAQLPLPPHARMAVHHVAPGEGDGGCPSAPSCAPEATPPTGTASAPPWCLGRLSETESAGRQLPTNFMANVAKYAEEDAVVFQGIDFILVGLLVFFRQYKMLGRHLVQLREPARSPAEVEAFLRARLVPIRTAAVKAE
mmetsp:Transcript_28628/g.59858  ORF Transcript_28628/g.59858 Transcript_28628/m.59858 type:complete len:159 (-) Transcript_28628:290-766(-)